MKRSNDYERAFEAYLQWHRLCYVAVDETRRSPFADGRLKSLDFIVHGPHGARLLVDVKGRRFPGGPPGKPRYVWECWSTRDDLDGLDRWAEVFGDGYRGLLVYLYRLAPGLPLPDVAADLWTWRGHRFLLRAITAEDYRRHLRVRSLRWCTVGLLPADFRSLARPFHEYLEGAPARVAECPF